MPVKALCYEMYRRLLRYELYHKLGLGELLIVALSFVIEDEINVSSSALIYLVGQMEMQRACGPVVTSLADGAMEWVRVTLNMSNSSNPYSAANGSVWEGVDLHDFYRERLTVTHLQNLVLVTLYVATFLLATSANSMALLVFWRFQHMRCLSNSLLITLAVSDLLVSIVCMPMAIGFYTYKLWIFGEVMCKLANYLQGVAVAASVFTMTVMSLDRYMVICHPIAFRKHLYRRHVGWSILLVWVLALLLFVPVLIVRKAHGVILHAGTSRELSFVYCVEDWSSDRTREGFAFATFTLVFVLPGATMAAAYCRIGVRLCGGNTGLNRSEGHAGKQLVAKRFLILTTVFAICWVPYNIATLLLDFQEYPMTVAASLRSSSLVWKKSLRKKDSQTPRERSRSIKEGATSATLNSGVSYKD
ncbi:unnamed protein product [Larinioides sclopetarius]|uniref:G-protein coupled receptors family 1 profile domain-containing protein n=1 Tax=Larinioides sclopetarius TaxID=280406 RepID=A0AAV2A0T7_9ARAC